MIRAGSFFSVTELVRDIKAYLLNCNTDLKPDKWRAKGEVIFDEIRRTRVVLDKVAAA